MIACHELVRYFKKSGLNSKLEITLKSDIITRWNSIYFMLKSIFDNYEQIEMIL